MIIYLIKLILILVFNICINICYINSGCECCCGESNKNNSGGGIKCDKFEIDLINNTLKCNGNVLTTVFKKIEADDLISISPQRVINWKFDNGKNIYYTIDEAIFNSIKKDNAVTITKNLVLGDRYIVFAVKTQAKKFEEKNPKYDYYLVYCHNGNCVRNYYGLFDGIDTNVEIKILGSGNNLITMAYMFNGCKNLEKITFTIKGLNTSNVKNMEGMFKGCRNLEELDLSTFNTNNVKNMYGMFSGCSSLKDLNLSNFNTNNVIDMSSMFFECLSLRKENIITGDKNTLYKFTEDTERK